MKHVHEILVIGSLSFSCVSRAEPPQPATVVEVSEAARDARTAVTVEAPVTERDREFSKKVTEPEINHWADKPEPPPPVGGVASPPTDEERAARATAIAAARAYTLAAQAGRYVGWFGIVRASRLNQASNRTELTLQHCYFDGLSDEDLQVVSIFGAGDFTASIEGLAGEIAPLSLVRVCGTVTLSGNGVANVRAEYVRTWAWGLFTFMNYGVDKTNPKWRALRKRADDDVYTSRPTAEYYESVLGPRAASGTGSAPAKTEPDQR